MRTVDDGPGKTSQPPRGGSKLQERCKYVRVIHKLIKKNGIKRLKNRRKKWSNKYASNIKIGTWNSWSYSNDRHEYCKSLGYDILALTELHNNQDKKHFREHSMDHK